LRKIIGLDTETYLDHGEYKFLSAQFYSPELGLKDFVTDPLDIPKYFRSKTRGAIFIAQNAEYDFSVLWKVLKEKDYVFKVLFNEGRFLYGKLAKNDHTWTFYDLRNIFVNWSLAKVGEFLGIKKLEKPEYLGLRKPETKKEWQYFKKYALRDAQICYEAGKWLIKNFGVIKVSAPSLSFYVFNKEFKPFGIYLKAENSIERKLRLAYKGGRSECFIRGSPDKKVYVYDVVSLYPYIMRNFKFPLAIGELKHKTSIDLSKEGIAYCYIYQDAEIPVLGLRMFAKDGSYKLVFPNGKFASYFTYPELRYLEWKGLGKILKVYEAWEVDRSAYIFKDFIDYYFDKKQKDPQGSAFWKLFLNSLYGKFAQNTNSKQLILTPDGKLVEDPKFSKKKRLVRTNLLIASYITARARIYMHQLYEKVGAANLVYTDTDSIHTFKPITQTGEGLGELSFKGETDGERRSTYVRSKFYIFNDVLKCKGLQYILKADDMRKLIAIGDVKLLTNMLIRIRSAFAWHKPVLSETKLIKRFTLEADGKRAYTKPLNGKQLLTDYTDSKPLWLEGLENGLE